MRPVKKPIDINKMAENKRTKGHQKKGPVPFGQSRRYLVNVETGSTQQIFTDCLVVGAGIAGLRAAIEAAEKCKVIVVCKGGLDESNTWNAQGGIASVIRKEDSFKSHIADTIRTGCGLAEKKVVDMVIRQGPELIKQLVRWGAEFDKTAGHLTATIEGGHSHSRIIHAHGDETGRIIAETLIKIAKQHQNIKILENFFAIDLLCDDENKCVGIIGQNKGGRQIIWSAKTILATGGAGELYRETTNTDVATADGIAMAWRAGAVLQDLEFFQFHPTTLYVAGASRALITEALRGEGAILLDAKGRAFMKKYHKDAELAPRDVVSRACLLQMLKTKSTHVYLDVRHLDKKYIAKRFPHIFELCESFDIDIGSELIPVRPSAHYIVGGVKTDLTAKTSVENLYACGETASTGLHGANRLASNSLLEGLVFGRTAGRDVCEKIKAERTRARALEIEQKIPHSNRTLLDTRDVRNSLKALMWRNVGITRKARPLIEAQEIIRFWQRYVMDKTFDARSGWECQNMLSVSLLMARCAQLRRESRGVHFRSDFPDTDDENFKKHTEINIESVYS